MPTAGRVPKEGHILPLEGFVDQMTMLGSIARKVGDLEFLLSISSAADSGETSAISWPIPRFETVALKGLRVGWFTDNGIMSPASEIAAERVEAGMSVEGACPGAVPEALDLTLDLWTADGGARCR